MPDSCLHGGLTGGASSASWPLGQAGPALEVKGGNCNAKIQLGGVVGRQDPDLYKSER